MNRFRLRRASVVAVVSVLAGGVLGGCGSGKSTTGGEAFSRDRFCAAIQYLERTASDTDNLRYENRIGGMHLDSKYGEDVERGKHLYMDAADYVKESLADGVPIEEEAKRRFHGQDLTDYQAFLDFRGSKCQQELAAPFESASAEPSASDGASASESAESELPSLLTNPGEMVSTGATYTDSDGFKATSTITVYDPVTLSESDRDTLLDACDPYTREQNTGVQDMLFDQSGEHASLDGAIGQAFEWTYESADGDFPFPFDESISTKGKYAGGNPGPLLVPTAKISADGLGIYSDRPGDACMVEQTDTSVRYIGFSTLWAPEASPNNPDALIQAKCASAWLSFYDPLASASGVTVAAKGDDYGTNGWQVDEPAQPFKDRCAS